MAQNNSTSAQKKVSFIDDVCDMAETVVISAFIVLLVFTFIVKIVTVDGTSMYPVLSDGDKLVISYIGYTPKVGDVVTIKSNYAITFDSDGNLISDKGLEKNIVKRIIAVGGQTVDIDFSVGAVTIDGNIIYENYINESTTRNDGAFDYPITIPEGYVFVMGDNRAWSKDSRHPSIGLVPVENIYGKVFFRLYPFDTIGFISGADYDC